MFESATRSKGNCRLDGPLASPTIGLSDAEYTNSKLRSGIYLDVGVVADLKSYHLGKPLDHANVSARFAEPIRRTAENEFTVTHRTGAIKGTNRY
jgi:hypothetical protein